MKGHEGHQIQGRGDDRGGNRPDGCGVPDPPDGGYVPEHEGQRGPSEHRPPPAPRVLYRVAHPQQGHQCYEEAHAGQTEPPC